MYDFIDSTDRSHPIYITKSFTRLTVSLSLKDMAMSLRYIDILLTQTNTDSSWALVWKMRWCVLIIFLTQTNTDSPWVLVWKIWWCVSVVFHTQTDRHTHRQTRPHGEHWSERYCDASFETHHHICVLRYYLFYRALLQKRRIILSILLTKATCDASFETHHHIFQTKTHWNISLLRHITISFRQRHIGT